MTTIEQLPPPQAGPRHEESPRPAPVTTTLRGAEPTGDGAVIETTAITSGDPAGHPGWNVVRSALTLLAVCSLALIFNLVVLSQLAHQSSQYDLHERLRTELAEGVAPVQPVGAEGQLLSDGSPVALLRIPDLDIDEVVLFGTTSGVLTEGVGLRRDSTFPGQRGTSVLMGRASAFGGPFGDISRLVRGAVFSVTTGQGVRQFSVVAARRAGDPLSPPSRSGGRLTLITATGSPFLPSGLVRVDADLVGTPAPTATPALSVAQLRPSERDLAGDPGRTWYLVFALQALLAAVVGAVVAWYRWGHLQAWVACGPVILLAAWWVGQNVTLLLPNLM